MVINSCLLSGKFDFQVLHPNSEEELVVQLEGTIIHLTITIVLLLPSPDSPKRSSSLTERSNKIRSDNADRRGKESGTKGGAS